ncbi:hypothetical protein CR513_19428, partial [Mucuna pruriens]
MNRRNKKATKRLQEKNATKGCSGARREVKVRNKKRKNFLDFARSAKVQLWGPYLELQTSKMDSPGKLRHRSTASFFTVQSSSTICSVKYGREVTASTPFWIGLFLKRVGDLSLEELKGLLSGSFLSSPKNFSYLRRRSAFRRSKASSSSWRGRDMEKEKVRSDRSPMKGSEPFPSRKEDFTKIIGEQPWASPRELKH